MSNSKVIAREIEKLKLDDYPSTWYKRENVIGVDLEVLNIVENKQEALDLQKQHLDRGFYCIIKKKTENTTIYDYEFCQQ